MIDLKYKKIISSLLMSLFMSCFMSLVICIYSIGLESNIIFVWLKTWAFSFIVAFPAIILISPVVYRVVNLVTNDEYTQVHK